MPDYISREAVNSILDEYIIDHPLFTDRDAARAVQEKLDAIPAANVVSRKHYLDALGTINEAHLHPECSVEIIDDFLKRYHTLCMEEPNDRT